uniref:Ribonuclease H-like domain-containing protein n=1 Tax=Tanacetum cinerariifolium TaxID=118510 RepID=A0A6L2N6G9_TANCI|nr:ribonuclease H-like domain-containing protein [Tanacetum cinerariifolium]
MESLSPQVVSAAKLPILNPNEFDLWKMRIEQYFLMTDYSLREVILNGDSPGPTRVIEGVVQPVAPTTAEHRLARKNELKARGTLLMDLPDKHQLKFNIHKDAKTLMEAIEKRFGGNKETKKRNKVYEAKVKSSSSASTSTQNIAFTSSQTTNSTNDPVSVVATVSAASVKILVSALPNVDTLSNAVIYSFFASQSNSPQLDNDDLKQIDADDLEEMDLKWQMTMECRSPKDTRRNSASEPQRRNVLVETSTLNALVSQCDGVGSYDWSFQAEEEPTNYALVAFTFSSSSSFDNEVPSCSKACTKSYATLQSHYEKLTDDFRKSQFDVISYKTGLESVEARLLSLGKKIKKAKQERDDLKLKLEKFQTSSKNLSQLLASQTNDKTGLGYNTQVFTRFMFDCDEFFTSKSDESLPPSPIYDRYQSGDGYHVVPPPYTGTFMPPKPDLVFHTASNVNETVHTAFNVELSPTKHDTNLSHTHRPSAPIIKDWVFDSEDDYKAEIPQNAPTILKPKSNGYRRNRKPCFVCKSLDHLIKDFDFYGKKIAQTPARNHAQRGNHQQYTSMTLINPQKHVVPTLVLTQSKLVPITAARPVTAAILKPHVTKPKQAKSIVTKPHLPPKRHINRSPSPKASNFPPKVTAVKVPQGNSQHALKDKGVIDSGCSRHITGNTSYLFDFEKLNGGYVAFGANPKGGKISGKGKIRTGKLDFDDVYFVKELKFNLFSVSQMCDKKNSVLFTDTECFVLSPEFKLPDENQVLLRVHRENNMYNVDLKNIVPSGDLTCLFAKGTLD